MNGRKTDRLTQEATTITLPSLRDQAVPQWALSPSLPDQTETGWCLSGTSPPLSQTGWCLSGPSPPLSQTRPCLLSGPSPPLETRWCLSSTSPRIDGSAWGRPSPPLSQTRWCLSACRRQRRSAELGDASRIASTLCPPILTTRQRGYVLATVVQDIHQVGGGRRTLQSEAPALEPLEVVNLTSFKEMRVPFLILPCYSPCIVLGQQENVDTGQGQCWDTKP
jgi:hypothetical protein